MFRWLSIFVIYSLAGAASITAYPSQFAHEGGYWNLMDGHIVMLNTYAPVGPNGVKKKYSVLKLSIREGASPEPLLRNASPQEMFRDYFHQTYVANVLKFVRAFVEKNYEGRERAEALEALKSERDFYQAPATWIIVTDENNLEGIHSVMRVVRKELLPGAMPALSWEDVVLSIRHSKPSFFGGSELRPPFFGRCEG